MTASIPDTLVPSTSLDLDVYDSPEYQNYTWLMIAMNWLDRFLDHELTMAMYIHAVAERRDMDIQTDGGVLVAHLITESDDQLVLVAVADANGKRLVCQPKTDQPVDRLTPSHPGTDLVIDLVDHLGPYGHLATTLAWLGRYDRRHSSPSLTLAALSQQGGEIDLSLPIDLVLARLKGEFGADVILVVTGPAGGKQLVCRHANEGDTDKALGLGPA